MLILSLLRLTNMAKKKYYAVKSGHDTGIFLTWDECKKQVDGFKGAEYKSFSSPEEAESWLKGEPVSSCADTLSVPEGTVIAYVDGSYEDSIKKYAFGCVLILPDGKIFEHFGNGDNPESLAIRNVAGEMIGAMFATRWAIINGFKEIEIRYDYEGIEKWVTGVWQTKNNLTSQYSAFMRNQGQAIDLHFTKVTAHSNNKYNDKADELAKRGLEEGTGVPEIIKEI